MQKVNNNYINYNNNNNINKNKTIIVTISNVPWR